jgi:hypothetical protein
MKLGNIPEQVLIVAAGVIVAGLIYHYGAGKIPLLEDSQDGYRFHVL